VPDSTSSRLLKVDGKLRVLDIIDHIDDDERPLQHPNSLALYRRFGQLFIVEARGGSYAWTGTEISELRVTRVDGQGRPGLQLDYRLSEPSLISVELLTGDTPRELMPARRRGAGARREWLALPAGADPQALLVVKAKPTYSAQQQLTVEQRLPLPPVLRSGEAP
jgi:hypothetical protein